MKIMYISPVFKNLDGTPRKLMISVDGLKTHKARDAAVMKMITLGGTSAPDTLETRKLMGTIIRAKRKIEKNGWFATEVK